MHPAFRPLAPGALGALVALSLTPGVPHAAPKAAPPTTAPVRWTDETPQAMIAAARDRAITRSEPEALAALVTIASLSDRAPRGSAAQALAAIAAAPNLRADVKSEASLLAQALAEDAATEVSVAASRALGVLTDVAILGPFRDTGGGIDAKDGPEGPQASFHDMRARYAWGSIDVSWRALPRAYASTDGVPLNLFVHPRKESCSWVASSVTVPSAQPIVVRLASSGQVRLVFDGVDIGKSDDVNESAYLDRLAARVEAAAGPHLVAAKVCSGAITDDGRVRLRLTNDAGSPLVFAASADLGSVRAVSEQPKAKRDPPKVQKIPTPLARALTPAADVDAQLAAATLRTLGGADDLKSPRAPGLLAGITKIKDLDADRLAMAAWLAPSGANRSGWLNLARARAAGDATTRAFIDRRLIAQHLNARLADWAMATRRAAGLDLAKDGEAVLLTAQVDAALGSDTLRLAALRKLVAASEATDAPSAVVRRLADIAQSLDPKRAIAARAKLAARGEHGLGHVDALNGESKEAMVVAARQAFATSLDNADEGIDIAKLVARLGAHEAAKALYEQLIRWAPNRAEAWAGLAGEISATSKAGDAAAAETITAALRRARELSPSDARFRAELELRRKRGGDAEANPAPQADDERYLAASQALLARRQGVPKGAPDVADRELYWLRAVVMHPDKRVSQLIHYAREVVIPPRTQDELYEEIPSEGEQTEIVRARVHRKDGGTAFPTEEFNEGARSRIRWPELEAGDTVEVAIRTWTDGPVGGRGDPPFFFLDFAGAPSTHPLLYNEVVVESLAAQPIYLDVLNGKPDRREDKTDGGRRVTRLVWDKPMVIADEPLAPQLTEIVPVIVGSTFKDWGDFRAWYKEAVRGFTEPDDEVKRLAAELTKGKVTRDEKLAALFNFVADQIRYVNYVSGEWWLPNRPQQLLARREGDCDDKAILLITLLRAVGIEAQEVMVQTRMTAQPSLLRAKGVAIPLFDHGIAYLPGPNGGTYLDATSPQSRLGPLPSMDARGLALRVDTGPAEIVELPSATPDSHGASIDWTITLKPDGGAEVTAEERHIGDGAFWLRSNLTEAGARAQYVQDDLLAGWFPGVEVGKTIEFKGDLAQGQAWVKYSATSAAYARKEQGELVVPLSPSATLASQIAPLVKRTLPISLPPRLAPMHETRRLRVVAPRGFHWAPLPTGGVSSAGGFGKAELEVTRDPKDPRVVLVKRGLVFDEGTIPVAKYPEWRAWLLRVDALMHKELRLLPGEGGAR